MARRALGPTLVAFAPPALLCACGERRTPEVGHDGLAALWCCRCRVSTPIPRVHPRVAVWSLRDDVRWHADLPPRDVALLLEERHPKALRGVCVMPADPDTPDGVVDGPDGGCPHPAHARERCRMHYMRRLRALAR